MSEIKKKVNNVDPLSDQISFLNNKFDVLKCIIENQSPRGAKEDLSFEDHKQEK